MNLKKDSRILVILPNNLGDIIMTTPVLEGLRAHYPHAHITFLAEEGYEDGLCENPHVDEIYRFKRKDIKALLAGPGWQRGIDALAEAVAALNNPHYSLVINFAQHQYLSYIASLLQKEVFYGCRFLPEGNHAIEDPWTHYLYAVPFARQYNALHVTDIYRRIAGVRSHSGSYTITVSEERKNEARQFLRQKGVDPATGKCTVFQVGAALSAKRWPPAHFITLGKLLLDRGWQIIISGAREELPVAADIHEALDRRSVLTAGETGFRQAMALCSLAQACVTGDTALMHAAAGLGVTTYALFGTTSPVETGPYGNGHFVFSAGCNQRPCFCAECKSLLCMKAILPEDVLFCIEHDAAPQKASCDIYRTYCAPDEDYQLHPLFPGAFAYYSLSGTSLVRLGFSDPVGAFWHSDAELREHHLTAGKFMRHLKEMKALLIDFLGAKNTDSIAAFEKKKPALEALGGIALFWSAVLNIRFNSIPMLNPLAAIQKHVAVIEQNMQQIRNAFSHFSKSFDEL